MVPALWLAVQLSAAPPAPLLSLAFDAQCERSLVTVLGAELEQAGVGTQPEGSGGDLGALTLRCDESQITAHLSLPGAKTTIERAFTFDQATRLRVAVKLSEFVHASLETALGPQAPVRRVPRGLPPERSAPPATPKAEQVVTQWQANAGVSLLVTPQLGAAPGLALNLVRRIGAWEVGLLGEAALSFPTIRTTGGQVWVTVGLASLLVARRFALTPSFRLRAGAGPGVLMLFADAVPSSSAYVSHLVVRGAFAASVAASAEYDFWPSLHGFLGVTVSWAMPRAILRLPTQSVTIAAPLISVALGVTFE